jgi:hypothetical protein
MFSIGDKIMNKKQLGKIFAIFGLTTILASMTDIIMVLIPLHLSDKNWVYGSAQEIAERSIIPLLGLIILLAGKYMFSDENSKLKLNCERLLGAFSFIFGLGLILITVFFTLTLSSIDKQVTDSIKQKGENLKKQVAISYLQQQGVKETTGKIAIPKELQKYFTEIDTRVKSETKSTKKTVLKKNIKTVINLLLFVIAYIFIGIITVNSANIALKQLKFKK